MNREELYDFSVGLNDIAKKIQALDVFHWYRFRYFVDNAKFDDPWDCKYVTRTATLGEQQSQLLLDELVSCRDSLDQLIGAIENG